MAQEEGLELAELIAKLRDDLEEAMEDGEGRAIRFRTQAVELELKLGVTRVAKGKAGIKFWVLDASVDGEVGKEKLQTVKLTLVPQVRDNKTGGYVDATIAATTQGLPR
jgi:hypothetical protein